MILFHFFAVLCLLGREEAAEPGARLWCRRSARGEGRRGRAHPGLERWHCSRPPLGCGQGALSGCPCPLHASGGASGTWALCGDFWEADQPQETAPRICVRAVLTSCQTIVLQ